MTLFGTSGIRGPVGEAVTADLALSVGRAVGSTRDGPVVVGRDARESGRWLSDAVATGLRECGVDVVDLGQVATPTLARSVAPHDAGAGVMVTASHNPPPDNGIKLWNPSGQAFDAEQRREVARRVREGSFDLRSRPGGRRREPERDPTARHVDSLVDVVEELDGLTVVVDVGNGVGGVTVDALGELGAEVRTLNARPDGRFPGRPSEPSEAHCTELRRFVAATDADLGLAHDGDADRLMAVTESGRYVTGDTLLALFAREAASRGDRVAAPVNTSIAVDDELAAGDVSVVRTKVGDVHVAERATDPEVAFGGEPSGAWIWPDETLCPDGPLAACRLAAIVAREGSLDSLVEAVDSYPIRRESVEVDRKEAVMEAVRETVTAEYGDGVTTTDGVHVDLEDGWFLVRASGTEPLVRATAEARDPNRADRLIWRATELISDAA